MGIQRRVARAGLCGAAALTALPPSPAAAQAGTAPLSPQPAGLDLFMPAPPGGSTTPGVVTLGRRLFFDPVLSRDSSLACASCHQPDRAFTDGRAVSVGVGGREGTRNVPTLVNRGWGRSFFWDGRTQTLEEQVLRPITAPLEMDVSVESVVGRLASDSVYRRSFEETMDRAPDSATLARALAAYVRSIRSGGSAFDRVVAGEDDVLSAVERRGMELFQGRARCDRGPLLSDEEFHNTGVAWRNGAPADSGRAQVTGRSGDIGAFKTPTLREIPRTAPYMHDGSLATLEEVVGFYRKGGHPNPALDPLIQPLQLTPADSAALVAFLRTLTGLIYEGSGSVPERRPTGGRP